METDLLKRICGELEQRMAQLRPLCEEYERLTEAAASLEGAQTAPPPSPAPSVPPPAAAAAPPGVPAPPSAPPARRARKSAAKRTASNEVAQAILAALEHGSHTVSELVMVSALSPVEIRGGLSRLRRQRKIAKVKRPGDGKSAYALPHTTDA